MIRSKQQRFSPLVDAKHNFIDRIITSKLDYFATGVQTTLK
jgi:hypothetical protein